MNTIYGRFEALQVETALLQSGVVVESPIAEVATQPGKSGEYAEKLSANPSRESDRVRSVRGPMGIEWMN
jgi:hypothetical protein